MCIFCDDGPIDNDPRPTGARFKTDMMNAPCADPLCCLASCFCPCPAAFVNRKRALEGDMTKYTCCQGYYDGVCCCSPGECGEQSAPNLCLCLEVTCCHSCAVYSTRSLVMDQKNLQSDPMDRRIVRFNNFCQGLACLCWIAALISGSRDVRDCARCASLAADLTYCTVQACMSTQVYYELQPHTKADGPAYQNME